VGAPCSRVFQQCEALVENTLHGWREACSALRNSASRRHDGRRELLGLDYCVYVLRSGRDGDLYTGYTENLERRVKEHQAGMSAATAPRRPLHLVLCEYYGNSADAKRREKYLKTSAGKRAIRLMLRETLKPVR